MVISVVASLLHCRRVNTYLSWHNDPRIQDSTIRPDTEDSRLSNAVVIFLVVGLPLLGSDVNGHQSFFIQVLLEDVSRIRETLEKP